MNWKECAHLVETQFPGSRFRWPAHGWTEFDCEKAFTISDVWGSLMWALTWHGDWLLSQEPLRTFFEIEGTSAIGTAASLGFGITILILALAFASVALDPILDRIF